jgi:hypothetical protein
MADPNPFDQFDAAPAPTSAAAADVNPFDQFDAPPPKETAPTEPKEDVGRVAGLGTRALMKGVGELHDMPQHMLDAIDTMSDSASNYVRGKLGLAPRAPQPKEDTGPSAADFLERGANAAGLPKPETAGERIGSAAVSSLPSAILAPEAPVAGAVGSLLGGASAQTAKEAGASPLVQAGAGMLGGSLPAVGAGAAGATRALVRGGSEGQSAMEGRLADAATSGTKLTAGQASGSSTLQYLEGTISKLWGGGPINKSAEGQTAALGDHVNHIVDGLSQGAEVSPTGAGSAIVKGIGDNKTPGSAFGTMHAQEKAAYDKLDDLVHPSTPIDMSGTQATLDKLAAPTPGAEATTGALTSSKISTLRDRLKADLEASQEPGGAAQKPVYVAGGNPPQLPAGSLPYSAARAIRSGIGNSIDWGFAPADPATNAALKQVYGSLTGDLKDGASAVSPEAAAAANGANKLYAANQARRDALAPIVDKAGGPEAVYQAATNGTKQGATKINQVMGAIGPDQQKIVQATVLSRLGRALPSAQNAEGSAFNANTFLTNWSKLDPAAKDALFGASGVNGSSGDLRKSLDSLSSTISNIQKGTKLRNPSGTGEAVGHGAGMAILYEGLTHAMNGNYTPLASAIGGVTANNLMARTLTNPRTAKWLAKTTTMPKGNLPNAVNQLNNLAQQTGDPDAKDLATTLTPEDRPKRASGGKVDHEALVEKLMKRWKAAKKATDATTKPLLNVPDAAIARALEIAGEHI